ncbi:MAG TPA: FUSC family protein [Rhodopila sp.]|nr:FUSC family protein [Rhodopila sp.]
MNTAAASAPAPLAGPTVSPLSLRTALPLLLYGVRLWAAVCLAMLVAFWLQLDNPFWAGTSAGIVCQPVLGASLRKGWFRMVGTILGAIVAVLLTAAFPQSRAGFFLALIVWGAACGFVASVLRNFASYAAALAGYTAVIVCSDVLGSIGVAAPQNAFILAATRATEISIGIVSAGIVLIGTDVGHARQRLAGLLAGFVAEIGRGLAAALSQPAAEQAASRNARRAVILRVAELDTVIDHVLGESPALRFRPRGLQAAMDGLIQALSGWRAVATHIERQPQAADADARTILPLLPEPIRSAPPAATAEWIAHAVPLRLDALTAVRTLVTLPAETPSRRLLADQSAEALLGLARALQGIAVLDDPRRAVPGGAFARLRVPDILPPLINAVRVALTMAVATLLWIGTAWPGGGLALVFAAVTSILFSPREDTAYETARGFMVGTMIAAVLAGLVTFLVLPHTPTYFGFCLACALVLVPAGALSAGTWQTPVFVAMAANFIPLLSPSNPMVFDFAGFLNTSVGLLSGVAIALLGIRVLPPLPQAVRGRRLAALALGDLRRLATDPLGQSATAWENKVFGRLAPMPEQADLVQGARIVAALAVGSDLIRLARAALRLGVLPDLLVVSGHIAGGRSGAAIEALQHLDRLLEEHATDPLHARIMMGARGNIAAIREALLQHSAYFEGEVRA